MNKLDHVENWSADENVLEPAADETSAELAEIEPEVLAQIAGGPDGTVLGLG
jgi:hypothetical protein